ncbi:MAG TPA: MarR family transcriptional regulator [Acidimicrobiales bacterium]|nr:MarR family transcriptional regulator [Acidimicrobiales bacterium]
MAPLPSDTLGDPLLTTAGLFVEAHAGFSGRLEGLLAQASGLSVQWFDVLMRLVRSPGHRLRMSDLAAQTTLSPSGLTRAVDRLEAAGLVVREACPSDRRGAFAVLTEAGEQRISAAVPVHLDHLRELFDAVYTAEEVETLTSLLRRLRDEVNPEAAAASDPRLLCDEERDRVARPDR